MDSMASPRRAAVLVDPGLVGALEPILRELPVPMLPAGTKPMIQHWLEHLARLGVTDVTLLLAYKPEKTRHFVGDGSRWGLSVSCVLYREMADIGTLKAAMPALDGLVALIDMASLPLFSASDAAPSAEDAHSVQVDPRHTDWNDLLPPGTETTPMTAADLRAFSSIREYWQLNMDLLRGELTDPQPFGFEASPGVWASSNCRLDADSVIIEPLIVGESALIRSRTIVGPKALIGAQTVVEEGVEIRESVILPGSFVGAHVSLDRVVVAGDVVYNIDNDLALYINDPEVVSPRERVGTGVGRIQQVLAAALVILFAPVWLLIGALLKARGQPVFVPETWYLEDGIGFSGERQLSPITLHSFNVAHSFWRRTPWFMAVLRGHLPLTGTSLRSNPEPDYPDWVTTAERFQPGVVSLAQVTQVDAADTEAVIVTDAYQLARAPRGTDWKLLLLWLTRLLRPQAPRSNS